MYFCKNIGNDVTKIEKTLSSAKGKNFLDLLHHYGSMLLFFHVFVRLFAHVMCP